MGVSNMRTQMLTLDEARNFVQAHNAGNISEQLHMRRPEWAPGWTTSDVQVSIFFRPTMTLYKDGDYYGKCLLPADAMVVLSDPSWEVVPVSVTGENTAKRPDAKMDEIVPPYLTRTLH
jgi:hypothetical protein